MRFCSRFIGLFLVFSVLSAAAQPARKQRHSSPYLTEPLIFYYDFNEGKQLVYIGRTIAWSSRVAALEQEQPRALSWSMLIPKPHNSLVIRDASGKVLQHFYVDDGSIHYLSDTAGLTPPPVPTEKLLDPGQAKTVGRFRFRAPFPPWETRKKQAHIEPGHHFSGVLQPTWLHGTWYWNSYIEMPGSYIRVIGEKGKRGLLDTLGNLVLPIVYQNISWTPDNSFILQEKNRVSLVNMDLQPLVPAGKYQHMHYLGHGKYAAQQDSLYYIIDRHDRLISTQGYTMVAPYHNGYAWVVRQGLHGHIDAQARELYEPCYDQVEYFIYGYARTFKNRHHSPRIGFVDSTGRVVSPPIYESATNFEGDPLLAWVKNKDWHTYIDTRGEQVADSLQYQGSGVYAEGLLAVKKQGKWGFVNAQGELVIDCVFDDVCPFSEGMARIGVFDMAVNKKLYGFIDRSGRVVVPAAYDMASVSFSRGQALVWKGKKGFSIDKQGKLTER